jgi:hypothetical protein
MKNQFPFGEGRNMFDIMVDLETLATTQDAVILSIGACRFDPKTLSTPADLHANAFYQNIDLDFYDSYPGVFRKDQRTIDWWLSQSEAALDALEADQIAPRDAIIKFAAWVKAQSFDSIWAKSPEFDLAILGYHFDYFGVTRPWSFRQNRDVRTAEKLARDLRGFTPTLPNGTVKHNALDDAISQSISIQQIYHGILSQR